MHSLSLASPSPPAVEYESRAGQSDVDMSDGMPSATLPQGEGKPTPTFVPRQIKHAYTRTSTGSTVPLRPSPLIHSQHFHSSSSHSPLSAGNETSSPSSSSEDSSPRKPNPHHEQHHSRSSSCASSSSLSRRAVPHHSNDGPLEMARTPSPSPLSMSAAGSSQQSDGRKLHPSPGMAQSPFPGGKQMLRYTMGYRDDCAACKSKSKSCAACTSLLP